MLIVEDIKKSLQWQMFWHDKDKAAYPVLTQLRALQTTLAANQRCPEQFDALIGQLDELRHDFREFEKQCESKSEICQFGGVWLKIMWLWLWRRMLRISWMEKRTDYSILQELEIKRELLGHVRKRKLTYYGHLYRDHGCQITKTVVEGYVEGRRRRGRPRKQYIDNIKQWTQLATSQCVRAAEDRSRWKQLVSQAMVADDYT